MVSIAKLYLFVLILLCVKPAWNQVSLTPPQLRLPRDVQPVQYQASLQLAPGQDHFKGHIRIDLHVLRATSVVWLNARSLQFQNGIVRVQDIETSVPVTTAWGAMENAGLIAYGNFLLSTPQQDTALRQRGRAETMEHEMAHQWFGDLVTMAWWDDIWLNEAFASWVERKLLDEWKPEWNLKAEAAQSTGILRADSLTTARKIRQPIETSGDIANAFDGITYGKGQAVIGMFENYVGAAAFQRAVQLYLSKHEWANATSSTCKTRELLQ